MNHQSLEQRLRQDAERIEADCPDSARRHALWRIETSRSAPGTRQPRWPWLASACALLVAVVTTWTLLPDAVDRAPETAGVSPPDLHRYPLMTDPDRLLARREAALEHEQQSLVRDLQALRDHVTANFEFNAKG